MISAVIIASGRATRLGDICKHKPKCLLPFGSVPFLRYLLFWLINNGISDIVVTGSVASQADLIEDEIQDNFPSSIVRLVIEKFPRSTAYSAYTGIAQARNTDVLLLTADNIWDVHLGNFMEMHFARNASCSALVTTRLDVPNCGFVKIDSPAGRVLNLYDPNSITQGTSASTMGLYAIKKDDFLRAIDLKLDVYVERESMQRLIPNVWSVVNNEFFFDFGTPENFRWLSENPDILLKYFGEPVLK